jgi:hypothetical protein
MTIKSFRRSWVTVLFKVLGRAMDRRPRLVRPEGLDRDRSSPLLWFGPVKGLRSAPIPIRFSQDATTLLARRRSTRSSD